MLTRIFIVDDHQIVRQGLCCLLERQPNYRVVGDAGDGRDALRLVGETAPDVIIMDISLPGLNGLEATRQIRRRLPQTKVIALSMHADGHFVLGALCAGAEGYVLKESAYEELVAAIGSVVQGQLYLSPRLTDLVVKNCLASLPGEVSTPQTSLTTREREVWQLLAEGYANQEIASRLKISVRTVECHRKSVMEKLNVRSLAGLVKLAIREGIISLEAG